MMMEQPIQDEAIRKAAIERLTKKREFKAHILAYVLVNGFLVAIWALTNAGFFWPMFPLFGWGIGIVFHAWDTFAGQPTEEQIQREAARIAGDRARKAS